MEHTIFHLLSPFRPLFSRQASFTWFIVVIFGFLLRFDHYGVSSIVRWLHLPATSYPLLIHFFHSSSWSLSEVMMAWITFCREKFTLVSLNGRLLILGDGIKISKESQCQPGLKFLHSPSQNQSKPQRFRGHHFGCTAFVTEKRGKFRPILQAAQIHEGVDELREQQNEKTQQLETAVSRMMEIQQHGISPYTVNLSTSALKQMINVVRDLQNLSETPNYPLSLPKLPEIAQIESGHYSVLMGYDFHIDDSQQVKLIEVNTNAGGL